MQMYDEMVETGVDWIGDIPLGWKIINTSRLFSFEKGKEAQRLTSEYIGLNEGQYPVYSGQTSNGGVIGKYREYEFDEAGCLLVTTVGAKAMTSRFISGRFSLSQNCLIMRPLTNAAIDARYYSYAVIPLFKKERSLIPDHMQPSMRMSDLSAYKLPLPTFRTQQKIADFLDQETAKIDNLIAKQERLLKLLEEKRRATITQAVTRGLDPHAELKETNIPWLGQIPAHWEVKRLKDVFSANDEVLGQKTEPDYTFEYIDISSVDKYRGIIKKEEMSFENAPSRARRIVREGDIIIGAVRTYLEAIAQISSNDNGVIVSTGFVVLRPKNTEDSDFYIYALRAGSFMASVVANSDGVSYPAINADKLMSLHIVAPLENERLEIVRYCKDEMSKMDNLKQKIQTQIKLLKERRTSLISHAVTGKIKI